MTRAVSGAHDQPEVDGQELYGKIVMRKGNYH